MKDSEEGSLLNRNDVIEVHYIAPIENVPSMLAHGILCFKEAQKLQHSSVAMKDVQNLRKAKLVPPGQRTIHDFANLYFHARNPMMYKRKDRHADLCVLRINARVLDIQGVVLTDGNAASDWARFHPSPDGLDELDYDLVFARDWRHSDTIEYWTRKRCRCAEVLVPNRVPADYLYGAYVSCSSSSDALARIAPSLDIRIEPDLFFA